MDRGITNGLKQTGSSAEQTTECMASFLFNFASSASSSVHNVSFFLKREGGGRTSIKWGLASLALDQGKLLNLKKNE